MLRDKEEVDIAPVGHSHIPEVEDRQGVLIFDPGHLKSEDKKGYLPSLGLIDLEARVAKLIALEKRVNLHSKKFLRK